MEQPQKQCGLFHGTVELPLRCPANTIPTTPAKHHYYIKSVEPYIRVTVKEVCPFVAITSEGMLVYSSVRLNLEELFHWLSVVARHWIAIDTQVWM